MLGKKTRMTMVAALAIGGAGVAGAQPAEAATHAEPCHASWDLVRTYPTGAPQVSTYMNKVYEVKVKNCGSRGQLEVDVAPLAVNQCLGKVGAGKTVHEDIIVTYQDMAPWNINPPEPKAIKAGC